jgi:hypothetical protein
VRLGIVASFPLLFGWLGHLGDLLFLDLSEHVIHG